MDATSYIQMYSFELKKRFFKVSGNKDPRLGADGQISIEDLIQSNEDPFNTFEDFFKTYLSKLKDFDFETVAGTTTSKKRKKIKYNTLDVEVDKAKRIISGFIDSGNYGLASKVIDDSAKVTKKVKVSETNQLRFFFLLHVPKTGKEGILLVQSIGSRTIRSQVERSLTVYLAKSKLKNKFIFELSTITVGVKGSPNVKQVKLLEKRIRSVSSRVSSGKNTKTTKPRLQSILIFDNGIFPWKKFSNATDKKKFIDTQVFKNYVKFENFDKKFDYDYKISLELGKLSRTITVNNTLNYNFGIELELNSTDLDKDGYPKHQKIKAKFLTEFLSLVDWYLN